MTSSHLENRIETRSLFKELGKRYLSYALSTIMSRSLPDVRDGLKPVHRRLLFAMLHLNLLPKNSYKKSARVVGDVMGKFHPHGEASIYDALVRLAQDFNVRYPLVDGQGNFGNIDGDNAAAMRYTESRLTEIADLLLEGIDENAVDFKATYDGEGKEPLVLPAAFPNLLANGATGIAVGMATSIPPHNVSEICDALCYLIKNPQCQVNDLIKYIPGPDFPTGGLLVESPESILKAYETGRGSFRVRAQWEVEEQKGGLYQVIITSIPYQVPKSRLIEKIAELLLAKKLPLLADIADESTTDIRLVLTPKNRTVPPELLMESLFKQTELETRIPLNMNVLNRGTVPQVMTLKEVLKAFLDHRQEVLCRRSQFRLDQILSRLEVLKGYLVAYLNLDEVIRLIREAEEPKSALIERFSLSEPQADAILNMRLRALHKLEEIVIKRELETLSQEQEALIELLNNSEKQWHSINNEIKALQKKWGKTTQFGKRLTVLGEAPLPPSLELEAFIEKEDVTLVCSEKGWIRTLKGHIENFEDIKYKEGDKAGFILKTHTAAKLIIAASNGRFYTLLVDKLPKGRGFGEPLRLMIDLPEESRILSLIIAENTKEFDPLFLLVSKDGYGFITAESNLLAQTRSGKQVLTLKEGSEAFKCIPITGDSVAVIGTNRRLLVFPLKDLPTLAKGRGVMLQKYHSAELSDLKIFNLEEGLTFKNGKKNYHEANLKFWQGKRGSRGHIPPIGFPKSNVFGE